jgi:hypothetical protein
VKLRDDPGQVERRKTVLRLLDSDQRQVRQPSRVQREGLVVPAVTDRRLDIESRRGQREVQQRPLSVAQQASRPRPPAMIGLEDQLTQLTVDSSYWALVNEAQMRLLER